MGCDPLDPDFDEHECWFCEMYEWCNGLKTMED